MAQKGLPLNQHQHTRPPIPVHVCGVRLARQRQELQGLQRSQVCSANCASALTLRAYRHWA